MIQIISNYGQLWDSVLFGITIAMLFKWK